MLDEGKAPAVMQSAVQTPSLCRSLHLSLSRHPTRALRLGMDCLKTPQS